MRRTCAASAFLNTESVQLLKDLVVQDMGQLDQQVRVRIRVGGAGLRTVPKTSQTRQACQAAADQFVVRLLLVHEVAVESGHRLWN